MQSTILKRSFIFAAALFAALALQVILANPAHAASVTWDGGGADTNTSTALNWDGDVAPVDGDTIVVDSSFLGGGNSPTITNDSLTSIAGVVLEGSAEVYPKIVGNDLILTGDTVNNIAGSSFVYVALDVNITLGANISAAKTVFGDLAATTLDLSSYTLTLTDGSSVQGVISGSGGLIVDGTVSLAGANTYTGSTQVQPSSTVVLRTVDAALGATGSTTVGIDGEIKIFAPISTTADMTLAENITFSGAGTITIFGSYFSPDGEAVGKYIFGGTVTLNSDITLRNTSKNVVFDDVMDNGNSINQAAESLGTLTLGTVLQDAPAEEVTTVAEGDDDSSATVSVPNNNKYIINGVRGNTWVFNGGVLNGTGTVGTLFIELGALLAPGLSPGCLSSGDLQLFGDYDIELNGATVCTQYDQTDVTGTVDVTGGTLNIIKLASYDPAVAGATFIIIKNDGTDAVTGEFTGLVEGAKTTVDGVEYTVSYVGGDGNDVTLTVAADVTATAPDTGFNSTTVNFLFIAVATLLATGGMVIAGRKLQ